MDRLNPVFNNQIGIGPNTAYFATEGLKKKIVKQLQGKSEREQEAIIEKLLKLLDVNLLAALSLAYEVAEKE
jgi:hypothetical protein